jgi:hypothetical protein
MIGTHRRRIRLNVCCDGMLPIWSRADQIDGRASLFDFGLLRPADRVAWRDGLKLAVGDLEEESHAGREDFAGSLVDLDPLAGVAREPVFGSRPTSRHATFKKRTFRRLSGNSIANGAYLRLGHQLPKGGES